MADFAKKPRTESKPRILLDVAFHPDFQAELESEFEVSWMDDAEDVASHRNEIVGGLSYQHHHWDAAVFDSLPKLRVLSNHGAGTEHIDLAEAARRGIPTGNTPNVVADATADTGFALLLAAARNVVPGAAIAHASEMPKFDGNWFGKEVSGATLGIVGLGAIGTKVARRAAGFDMEVLYTAGRGRKTPAEEAAAAGAAFCATLGELLRRSDFVVLCCPVTPATTNLIGAAELAAMKSGSLLINIARGAVLDHNALADALLAAAASPSSAGVAAAALDVTAPEPLPRDSPLLRLPNCLITPHLGTATYATRKKMFVMARENLRLGLAGGPLKYPIS